MVSAVLFSYALILTAFARLLGSRQWTTRAPRLAIVTWQCLTASVLAALVSGGLALLVPSVHLSVDLAQTLRACIVALRAQYTTPAGTAAGAAGAVLAAAVTVRMAIALVITLIRTARWRRQHCAALAVLSSPAPFADACVLAGDAPLVYCLPGPQRRIVLTTGALRQLNWAELDAVLSHERAHLRQRHHLVLIWTAALRQAFPWSRLARIANQETTRLIELLADDAAVRTNDRLDLAAALLHLSGSGAAPRFALGAADSNAAQRVRRLIDPPRRVSRTRRTSMYILAAMMLLLPILTLIAPAAASSNAVFCPVHLVGDSSNMAHH
jgi:Zn-dependent protease with chaperone function